MTMRHKAIIPGFPQAYRAFSLLSRIIEAGISFLRRFLRSFSFLLVLNIFFITVCTLWINIIPYGDAPDEMAHYGWNVSYIIKHLRLPVSGRDDLDAYRLCRKNDHGVVPCTYSYVAYPGFNYVISAAIAVGVNEVFSIPLKIASRYASLLWGLVYLNSIFFIAMHLLKSPLESFFTTLPIAFIPQVIFVASYTNQDIHSLALCSLLLLAGLKFFGNEKSALHAACLGVALGLALLIKYNFIILPFLATAVILLRLGRLAWASPSKRQYLRSIALIALAAFCVSAFWYIRNYVLYHDLLGQNFVLRKMGEFHPYGTPLKVDDRIYRTLLFSWWAGSFDSFFGVFDFMTLKMPKWIYQLLVLALVTSGFYSLYEICRSPCRDAVLGAIALFAFFCLLSCMSIMNFIYMDYQTQGRYLFALLPAAALFIAFLNSTYRKLLNVSIFWCGLVVFMVLESTLVMLKRYH